MFAFATSPHGLGMTPGLFWGLTPREYDAFREQWEESRRFQHVHVCSGLQATLHNGHNGIRFEPPNGVTGVNNPGNVMPGCPYYKAPVQTGDDRARMARLRHAFSQKMTPEARALMEQQHIDSQHRHERARKAKENGATREDVIAIMDGKE